MKIDVSRHRAWIEAAVAAGEYASPEEAVDAALAHLEYERAGPSGYTPAQLREEVARGLSSGPAEPWEGADAFISRMRSVRGA